MRVMPICNEKFESDRQGSLSGFGMYRGTKLGTKLVPRQLRVLCKSTNSLVASLHKYLYFIILFEVILVYLHYMHFLTSSSFYRGVTILSLTI